MVPKLKEKYKQKVVPELLKLHGYENIMQAPGIEKIVINACVGTDYDRDVLKGVQSDLARITGQKPKVTKASKSVSNFKLRQGMDLGAKVTLRQTRMFEFLERLINVALPRIRDFRGVRTSSFDSHGNYSMGITDQTIFPEIDHDKVKHIHGMDITIVTTAQSDEEARDLLKLMGMPFKKSERENN